MNVERRKLQKKQEALLSMVPDWREIIRGTLMKYYLTCGNVGCRCHRKKEYRHGPYWYVAVSWGKGKQKMYLLKPDQVRVVRDGIKKYHRLWKQLCRIAQINLELVRVGS